MFAFIKGLVRGVEKKKLLLVNQGMGYWVGVSSATMVRLAGHSEAELYVHHHIREDDESLYGFISLEELRFFESLIKVSGVGPKVALSIMDAGDLSEIRQAIEKTDVEFLTSIPGIGKKSATKVILELKGKLGNDIFEAIAGNGELYRALESFGYTKPEIRGVVGKVDSKATIEEQLKQALRMMSE